MKVLLVAYACRPGEGSEPGVGWNTAVELSKHHEVWVITRRRNAQSIERAGTSEDGSRIHFVYHDIPRLARLKKSRWSVYPYHYIWQMTVWRPAMRLHCEIEFDVAHQITLGSIRFPSSLPRLGIPTVLGPLGGGEAVPRSFLPSLGARGASTEFVRRASNRLAMRDPLVRRSLARADVVLAASHDTARFLGRWSELVWPASVQPSVAIEPAAYRLQQRTEASGPLRALFVARLEYWKGGHLALAAVAAARRRGAHVALTVLGRGPERERLEQLAKDRHLTGAVSFIDNLPAFSDVLSLYAEHDVLLFPSLRESGGMAVVEAMAAGIPVVCLDVGGPPMSVADSGFVLPASSPDQVVADMADVLAELWRDPAIGVAKGRRAEDLATREYTWSARAGRLSEHYLEAVERHRGRSDAASVTGHRG